MSIESRLRRLEQLITKRSCCSGVRDAVLTLVQEAQMDASMPGGDTESQQDHIARLRQAYETNSVLDLTTDEIKRITFLTATHTT